MASPAIRAYRDLLVWQRAMDLALLCEKICDGLPKTASYLCLQIRRAANSVHANIAEGAFELCVVTGKLLGGLTRSLRPQPST